MNYWIWLLLFWAAFFGFQQSTDLDVIQILAVMAALLFVPLFIVNRMMSLTGRTYCDAHEDWVRYLLIGVTVLTVIVYQFGDTPFHRYASNEFTRFGALWWCCWPYGCLGLLMADRVFDVFEKLTPLDTTKILEMLGKYKPQIDEEDQSEEEPSYLFDPKRFNKDRLH